MSRLLLAGCLVSLFLGSALADLADAESGRRKVGAIVVCSVCCGVIAVLAQADGVRVGREMAEKVRDEGEVD